MAVTGFALFDKPGVFPDEAGIEHNHDARFVGDGPHLPHVLHGKGLPPDEVGGSLQTDKGNGLHSHLVYKGFEFSGIHIAFERVIAFHLERFVGVDFVQGSAVQLDMRLGGGEVVVHWNMGARRDEGLADDVFGGPPLMHRQNKMLAEHLQHPLLQPLIALAAGIGVVGHHHGGGLTVAHGVTARVGQHIEKGVFGAQ